MMIQVSRHAPATSVACVMTRQNPRCNRTSMARLVMLERSRLRFIGRSAYSFKQRHLVEPKDVSEQPFGRKDRFNDTKILYVEMHPDWGENMELSLSVPGKFARHSCQPTLPLIKIISRWGFRR